MHLRKLNFLLVCIYITLRLLITLVTFRCFITFMYFWKSWVSVRWQGTTGPVTSKCHTNAEFIISSLTTVTYSQLNYFKKLKPAIYLSIKWHALLFPLRPGNQGNEQLTVEALKWFTLSTVIKIPTDNHYENKEESKPERDSMSSVLWTRQIKQQHINSLRDLPNTSRNSVPEAMLSASHERLNLS